MYAIVVTESNTRTKNNFMFGIKGIKIILELDKLHCVRKARKFCKT